MKTHHSPAVSATARFALQRGRKSLLASLFLAGSLVLPAGAALAEGDAAAGEKLFRQCSACHTIGEGQPSRMGPNLHGMFGRKVGDVDGFNYSKTYQEANEAGEVWTPENFETFIENPQDVYKGGRMVLQVRKPEDRANLTAFLLANSPDYEAEEAE